MSQVSGLPPQKRKQAGKEERLVIVSKEKEKRFKYFKCLQLLDTVDEKYDFL